jgi:CO/xanthine dehydrogenase FAD-binding subunit
MKPAPFEYIAPESLEQAVEVLVQYGDESKILAGGQSLMPLLNMRLTTPGVVVDINGLDELSYIRQEGEHLHIGALTRQYRLERDTRIRQTVPVLAAATRLIGHPPIRYAGTIGGSLAHADPAAELPAVMRALEAELAVVGPSGVRSIQAADFFQGALAVDIRPDELLTEVRIPIRQNVVWGMREYTRRAGDFALAGAVVLAEMEADRWANGRVVLFGVEDRPLRVAQAEAVLTQQALSADQADAVAAAAVDGLDCHADLHASAGYRKQLARVMAKRAYLDAVAMWDGKRENAAGSV